MKSKNNIGYFESETNYVSLLENEQADFYKDVVILDFFVSDHKKKETYYIAYLPNLIKNNFEYSLEGEVQDFPEYLVAVSLQIQNKLFYPQRLCVEIPYQSDRIPELKINNKIISFRRSNSFWYIRSKKLLNRKVLYPYYNKAVSFTEGKDYTLTQISNGLTINYNSEITKKVDSIAYKGEFIDQVNILSENVFQLRKTVILIMTEFYYRFKIYKIKSVIDRKGILTESIDITKINLTKKSIADLYNKEDL